MHRCFFTVPVIFFNHDGAPTSPNWVKFHLLWENMPTLPPWCMHPWLGNGHTCCILQDWRGIKVFVLCGAKLLCGGSYSHDVLLSKGAPSGDG